jgi:precorrin-2 dehydrogenase/sirohydrochlorin ferrochelatase
VYPVCLEIKDKLCVVVGGGRVAERKVAGLLAEGARVRVVSPDLTEPLAVQAAANCFQWLNRGYEPGDLDNALLVFAATDNHAVQNAVVRDARRVGQLVNVIDAPAACAFQVPAVVRQGDLTLTVSTRGKSPALAAMVRQQLEKSYGKEYALLLELMSRLREQVLAGDQDCAERKKKFQNILHDDILLWIKAGQWELLQNHLNTVLGSDVDFDVSQPGRDE